MPSGLQIPLHSLNNCIHQFHAHTGYLFFGSISKAHQLDFVQNRGSTACSSSMLLVDSRDVWKSQDIVRRHGIVLVLRPLFYWDVVRRLAFEIDSYFVLCSIIFTSERADLCRTFAWMGCRVKHLANSCSVLVEVRIKIHVRWFSNRFEYRVSLGSRLFTFCNPNNGGRRAFGRVIDAFGRGAAGESKLSTTPGTTPDIWLVKRGDIFDVMGVWL